MNPAEAFQKYRQSINPPYGRKNALAIVATLFILIAIPLTVFSILQVREPRPKAAAGEDVQQVTTNIYRQEQPDISGNKIVYTDLRNGNREIYLYDLDSKLETRITNDPAEDQRPDIDGNQIVWMRGPYDTTTIWVYDLTTGTQRQIGSGAYPKISGNKVAWLSPGDVNSSNVIVYDLGTSTQKQITTNPTYLDYVNIDGNKVVWCGMYSGGDREIFLYDLTTSTERQITNDSINQHFPDISGSTIAYTNEGSDQNNDIWVYDISTSTARQITNSPYPASETYPRIDGQKVVWTDSRNTNEDIYLYDLTTSTETQITSNNSDQYAGAISGNRIVWEDLRNAVENACYSDHNDPNCNSDVYMHEIPTTPVCTRANPTVSLSPPSQSGAAGTTLSYTVSVTNNDNSVCSNSTFSLSRTVPSGWSVTLSATSLNLAPGAKDSSTLINITSSATATAGSYNVSATATSGLYTATGTATDAVTSSTKPGDLNGDNKVDILDLSKLISNWSATSGVADINKDGIVNILDLSILLSNWGT